MKKLGKILGVIGLGLTIIPAFLIFGDIISLEQNKNFIFAGTVLWFVAAPLALKKHE